MKSSTLLSLALASLAAAQPHRRGHRHAHPKRAGQVTEWVTVMETETATLYIDESTTTLILPTKAPKTTSTTTSESKPAQTSGGQFKEPAAEKVAPAPPPPTTTPSPSPPPPEPTSVAEVPVVAPPPSTSAAPAPAPSPSPSPSPSESGGSTGGSSGKPSTGVRHGDMTHYTVGMGSCGIQRQTSDGQSMGIVALSAALMVGPSNGHPNCGKTITISAGGKTAQATVEDKCPSCAEGAIDVSEKVFMEIFGDLGVGRKEVEWWFN